MIPSESGVPRRIAVVEDHESVVLGMSAMLASTPDLQLVATAATVAELLAITAEIDLAILDLRLADRSLPEQNVATLRQRGIEVLVFTAAEHAFLIRSAARAGVLGVMSKGDDCAAVLATVRRAASGDEVVTQDWAAAIYGDPSLSFVGLSPRQEEVLTLYASGVSAARVGRMTGLSEQTVIDYLCRIRRKYADAGRPAPTKTDLYKRAVEDGWLPAPHR